VYSNEIAIKNQKMPLFMVKKEVFEWITGQTTINQGRKWNFIGAQ